MFCGQNWHIGVRREKENLVKIIEEQHIPKFLSVTTKCMEKLLSSKSQNEWKKCRNFLINLKNVPEKNKEKLFI